LFIGIKGEGAPDRVIGTSGDLMIGKAISRMTMMSIAELIRLNG
jgi:hypothetical protein